MPTADTDDLQPLPERYAAMETEGGTIVFDQAGPREGWVQSSVAVDREDCR